MGIVHRNLLTHLTCMEMGAGKAYFSYRRRLHLSVYRETLRYFERKECLANTFVLHLGLRHL